MHISVTEGAIEAFQVLAQTQAALAQSAGKIGASAHFIGTMRDFNQGDEVQAMYLEHYPEMTQKQLHEIGKAACDQWPIVDLLITHRVGLIKPNDTIVVVGVWSAHRGPALAACEYLIETLKSTAPFWKKEQLIDGTDRWVTTNTPAAAADAKPDRA